LWKHTNALSIETLHEHDWKNLFFRLIFQFRAKIWDKDLGNFTQYFRKRKRRYWSRLNHDKFFYLIINEFWTSYLAHIIFCLNETYISIGMDIWNSRELLTIWHHINRPKPSQELAIKKRERGFETNGSRWADVIYRVTSFLGPFDCWPWTQFYVRIQIRQYEFLSKSWTFHHFFNQLKYL